MRFDISVSNYDQTNTRQVVQQGSGIQTYLFQSDPLPRTLNFLSVDRSARTAWGFRRLEAAARRSSAAALGAPQSLCSFSCSILFLYFSFFVCVCVYLFICFTYAVLLLCSSCCWRASVARRRASVDEACLRVFYSRNTIQKCTSKDIWRQGIVLKHRISLNKSLCPVVICPYLCSSKFKKMNGILSEACFLILAALLTRRIGAALGNRRHFPRTKRRNSF